MRSLAVRGMHVMSLTTRGMHDDDESSLKEVSQAVTCSSCCIQTAHKAVYKSTILMTMLSTTVLYHPNVSTAGIETVQRQRRRHHYRDCLSVDCPIDGAPESFNCCAVKVKLKATRPSEQSLPILH